MPSEKVRKRAKNNKKEINIENEKTRNKGENSEKL